MAKKSDELRRKAEEIIRLRKEIPDKELEEKNLDHLIEELSIYQVEMELQNDELINQQDELDIKSREYTELFDSAPIGYILLDQDLNIVLANNTLARMLSRSKQELKKSKLSKFVHPDFQDHLYLQCRKLFEEGGEVLCEVKLKKEPDEWMYCRLLASFDAGASHMTARVAVLDITTIKQKNRQVNNLLKASRALNESSSFEVAARAVFDACCDAIGATSGYVALLSEDGEENEVLFLEAGGLPCSVDPELPMPIRGLRADAYHDAKVVYHNDFMKSKHVKFMPEGHVVLKNVMFSPLTIDGKVQGIMGLANKASDFTEEDASMAKTYGELAALALRNKMQNDLLMKHNELLEEKVRERTEEIASVNNELMLSNKELVGKNKELEKYNDLFVGREFRIKELKDKLDKLKEELNRVKQ
jgi:PAS domain S-box-containing protein